uniref:Uncharacterized protein n=1 Tax=Fusarium oxysporum (strain Fo5176) TaxID=660025 RepID=A0A0D2YHL5_FUSOF
MYGSQCLTANRANSNFRHELIEGNTPPSVAVRPLGDSILDPGGNMQSQLIIPRFPKLVEMCLCLPAGDSSAQHSPDLAMLAVFWHFALSVSRHQAVSKELAVKTVRSKRCSNTLGTVPVFVSKGGPSKSTDELGYGVQSVGVDRICKGQSS